MEPSRKAGPSTPSATAPKAGAKNQVAASAQDDGIYETILGTSYQVLSTAFMDPITHLMTGGCMARAGFNRKTALATVTMVLAAEAPDIDVISEVRGGVSAFADHRGITHTFLGVPLVAALVVLAVWAGWRLRRRFKPHPKDSATVPRWGMLYGLACLAALSHILLDFTNSYGVRPFMPFYDRWYSWDIAFIYDPVLWIVLAGGLLLPSLFRLVDTEIGVRNRRSRGRVGAIVALVLVVIFWAVRDYEHRRALAAMQALTYRGEDAVRMSAYPYPVNPFRWYGVVETTSFFDRMDVDSLAPQVDPQDRAEVRPKPEQTPVTVAAEKSYLGRVYMNWAQYPVTEVEKLEPPESGYVVRFYDLRYMYPGDHRTFLSGQVWLNDDLKVVAQRFGERSRRD
jgi:inner membrane protein